MISFSRKPMRPTANDKPRWRSLSAAFRNTVETAGYSDIKDGARLIGALHRQFSSRSPRSFLQTDALGRIDIFGSALLHGVSAEILQSVLADRRKQTARTAWAIMILAAFIFCYWVHAALHMPDRFSRVMSLAVLILFETILTLVAFENAWINWQIRGMRLGSPGAYLRTRDPFLPRY
jgi:hypothetical protein